jgi:hypothetical protein
MRIQRALTPMKGAAVPLDADYQAVLNQCIANGYTLPAANEQAIANQLMIDLKAASSTGLAGYKLIAIYATNINYGGTIPADLGYTGVNWAAPTLNQASRVNTIVQTVKVGYSSNGVDSYINRNQSTGIYNQDDFFIAQGVKDIQADSQSGTTDISFTFGQLIRWNGGDLQFWLNSAPLNFSIGTLLGTTQRFFGARTSANNVEGFINNISVATALIPSVSVPFINDEDLGLFYQAGRVVSGANNIFSYKIKGNASVINTTLFDTAMLNYLTSLSLL